VLEVDALAGVLDQRSARGDLHLRAIGP